jgi:hypothetical protein
MRLTIELPDALHKLHKRIKAEASLKGTIMREFFLRAIEKENNRPFSAQRKSNTSNSKLKAGKRAATAGNRSTPPARKP